MSPIVAALRAVLASTQERVRKAEARVHSAADANRPLHALCRVSRLGKAEVKPEAVHRIATACARGDGAWLAALTYEEQERYYAMAREVEALL